LREDASAYFLFMLAHQLGKSLQEILALPADEIVGWRAYFQVRQELQDAG